MFGSRLSRRLRGLGPMLYETGRYARDSGGQVGIQEATMQLSGALHQTLIGRLWPEKSVTALRWGVLILVGSLFLAACAQITVWTIPVPITMQTFGVLVIGAVYGWRLG